MKKAINETKKVSKIVTEDNGEWKPLNKSSTYEFLLNKPEIGIATIGKNPFYGKGKGENPEEVLYFNNHPCPTHFSLIEIANKIKNGELKNGVELRITFRGVVGKGKRKFANYDIEYKG